MLFSASAQAMNWKSRKQPRVSGMQFILYHLHQFIFPFFHFFARTHIKSSLARQGHYSVVNHIFLWTTFWMIFWSAVQLLFLSFWSTKILYIFNSECRLKIALSSSHHPSIHLFISVCILLGCGFVEWVSRHFSCFFLAFDAEAIKCPSPSFLVYLSFGCWTALTLCRLTWFLKRHLHPAKQPPLLWNCVFT